MIAPGSSDRGNQREGARTARLGREVLHPGALRLAAAVAKEEVGRVDDHAQAGRVLRQERLPSSARPHPIVGSPKPYIEFVARTTPWRAVIWIQAAAEMSPQEACCKIPERERGTTKSRRTHAMCAISSSTTAAAGAAGVVDHIGQPPLLLDTERCIRTTCVPEFAAQYPPQHLPPLVPLSSRQSQDKV